MNDRVRVIRNEPGFIKLFTLFKEKYRSLGRVGGAVSIQSFSTTEVESIAGFLGQSGDMLIEKGKISLVSFEKEMQHTAFANFSFIQLLEEVLQESILTKIEENDIEQQNEREFLRELYLSCPEGSWWWEWIESKHTDTRWIWSIYKQDPIGLFEKLTTVYKAFRVLLDRNEKYEKLPLFAQRTTGNPHFFDRNQIGGKLLVHCMQVDQQRNVSPESAMPRTVEQLNDLLSSYGLMRDDLWSFVSCRGFFATTESGPHSVWQAAVETDTLLNVPIKELMKLKRIWPAKGQRVWIVENSSVCSTLVDEVPEVPMICTHGQFRSASWMMLDLLVDSGCLFYYSGDLDPEGIAIAQRLQERYPNRVSFWRMDQASYAKSISEEDISSRLAKLESITSPELKEVANLLKEQKKAGYQEGIVEDLVGDLRRSL